MKMLGFDHVGICARDPKAMADWYVNHLDAAEPAVGWKHIALVPENFDEAVKEMLALGVPVVSGPNYRDDGYCTFFFRDPDGNIVHFAKWANDRGMFK